MKRIYLVLIAALCLALPASGAGIESTAYNNLVATITRVREPVVSGKYVVFTAPGNARHVGISFEFEKYQQIHSFKRIIRRDEFGKPQKDETGKLRDEILFYVAEIPPATSELRYRMVIDGLWTTDPQNGAIAYDYDNGMDVSTLPVTYYENFQTNNVSRGQIRFACEAKPGMTVTLAGTFNNWDPFMYEMEETSPGRYELALPLPRGTWYYAYFLGTSQLADTTNHERVYTKDGRVASVVTVD